MYPRYKGGRPPKFTLAQRWEIKKIAKPRQAEHPLHVSFLAGGAGARAPAGSILSPRRLRGRPIAQQPCAAHSGAAPLTLELTFIAAMYWWRHVHWRAVWLVAGRGGRGSGAGPWACWGSGSTSARLRREKVVGPQCSRASGI
jgi:hypothetical protein